jgi:hypothetical protein
LYGKSQKAQIARRAEVRREREREKERAERGQNGVFEVLLARAQPSRCPPSPAHGKKVGRVDKGAHCLA